MKKHLIEYVRYNLWANNNLVQLFKTVDDALVSKEITSSFPSIRATLIHLWDVETLWLSRLRGISPTEFPSKNFNGSNAEVYDLLLKISKEFLEFVENQPTTYFKKKIAFNLMTAKGGFEELSSDMILHCVNHQSSHRGQLITMARQVGITQFPRTDFIIFKREFLLNDKKS